MSDAVDPHLSGPDGPRTTSCATELVCRECGYLTPLLDSAFKCPACGEGLDIDYDYERAKALIAERGLDDRPWNIWRFEELLPIVSRSAQQRVGQFAGQTPLIRADRLGAELGLKNLYLKDDSTNRPTLSYKDRVVGHGDRPPAGAGQRRGRLRLHRQRRHRRRGARRQGRRHRLHLLPGQHGEGQGEGLSRPRRPGLPARRQLRPGQHAPAASSRWRAGSSSPTSPCARSTPRGRRRWPSRSSSSSAGAAPDHMVIPAAGGTLSSRVHKGLNELEIVGLAETARDQDQHRPGERLLADRDRDPRGRRAGEAGAGNRRALAGDRRPRRRQPRARRGADPRRLGRRPLRPGDLRGDRPARRHRGPADRAGRRHHDRRHRAARRRRARSAPTRPSSR